MITRENTFTNYPDIVSVNQMIEMLDIGRNKAYELLTNGDIGSIKIGRIHKIPTQSIIEYINRNMITH